MTRVLWILLLSIPLAFSVLLVLFLSFNAVTEFRLDSLTAAFLFGGIAFYLRRLLIEALGESGGDMEETEFPDKINLAFGGKKPGLFTYLTYLFLGPTAFLLFNRDLFRSKSCNPQLNKTQRKQMGLLFMTLVWLLLLGAVGSITFELGVAYVAIAVLAILLTWPVSIGVALLFEHRKAITKSRIASEE
jgi:hypothetical protein